MQDASDDKLATTIFAAREGDEQAVALLFIAFGGDVRAACRHFGLSAISELSQSDLQQEAWLRIWSRLGSFRGHSDPSTTVLMFRAWIQVTAKNVVTNLVNRTEATKRQPQPQEKRAAARQEQESPSETVRREELNELLTQRIANLSDEQQQIMRLCFSDGVSLKQAAADIGITYDQARHRFSTAITTLKRLFDESDS
jgi:RNA polymerase sigma-70 factor, ECF subfamily